MLLAMVQLWEDWLLPTFTRHSELCHLHIFKTCCLMCGIGLLVRHCSLIGTLLPSPQILLVVFPCIFPTLTTRRYKGYSPQERLLQEREGVCLTRPSALHWLPWLNLVLPRQPHGYQEGYHGNVSVTTNPHQEPILQAESPPYTAGFTMLFIMSI